VVCHEGRAKMHLVSAWIKHCHDMFENKVVIRLIVFPIPPLTLFEG